MVKVEDDWICSDCNPEKIETINESPDSRTPSQRSASLDKLPTTDSGAVRKQQAMQWLNSLSKPTDQELKDAFLAKPSNFSGSTFPTSISNVRITGDPKFVETVAGMFKAVQDLENGKSRLELNLQKTEDKETGELTGNYALYLSVAERG